MGPWRNAFAAAALGLAALAPLAAQSPAAADSDPAAQTAAQIYEARQAEVDALSDRERHHEVVARIPELLVAAERALGGQRTLDHLRVVQTLITFLARAGRFAEAFALVEEHREVALTIDPMVAGMISRELADITLYQGDYDAAIGHFQDTLANFRRHAGPRHGLISYALNATADAQFKAGAADEAVQSLLLALDIIGGVIGVPRNVVVRWVPPRSGLFGYWRIPEGYWELNTRATIQGTALVQGSARRLLAYFDPLADLAWVLLQHDPGRQLDIALALIEEMVADHVGPQRHPSWATVLRVRAGLMALRGRPDEAVAVLEAAIALRDRLYGPGTENAASHLRQLGGVLRAAGDTDGAIAAWERALRIETEQAAIRRMEAVSTRFWEHRHDRVAMAFDLLAALADWAGADGTLTREAAAIALTAVDYLDLPERDPLYPLPAAGDGLPEVWRGWAEQRAARIDALVLDFASLDRNLRLVPDDQDPDEIARYRAQVHAHRADLQALNRHWTETAPDLHARWPLGPIALDDLRRALAPDAALLHLVLAPAGRDGPRAEALAAGSVTAYGLLISAETAALWPVVLDSPALRQAVEEHELAALFGPGWDRGLIWIDRLLPPDALQALYDDLFAALWPRWQDRRGGLARLHLSARHAFPAIGSNRLVRMRSLPDATGLAPETALAGLTLPDDAGDLRATILPAPRALLGQVGAAPADRGE